MAGRGCGENAGRGKRDAGKVDVREFIEVSRNDVDPEALAKAFAEELVRTLSRHGVSQEKMELVISV